MTFSYSTKLELCKVESKAECCKKAECFAMLLYSRFLSCTSGEICLENGAAARKMSELTALCTGAVPEVRINLRRKGYNFSINGDPPHKFFGIEGKDEIEYEDIVKNAENSCCPQAFLRGAFIACGIVSDPSKNYRLEFVVQKQAYSQALSQLIAESLGILPSIATRQGSFVVYIKDSAQIEDTLTFIGASNASMSLMQTKMYKEALNNINRKTNFETANMDKTYSASAKQTAAIALIIDEKGLDFIPDDLKPLAEARLYNPEMSLNDLALKTGLSRSAVNYKLQKLMRLGADLGLNAGIVLKRSTK